MRLDDDQAGCTQAQCPRLNDAQCYKDTPTQAVLKSASTCHICRGLHTQTRHLREEPQKWGLDLFVHYARRGVLLQPAVDRLRHLHGDLLHGHSAVQSQDVNQWGVSIAVHSLPG